MEETEYSYKETTKEKRIRARERLLTRYRKVVWHIWRKYEYETASEVQEWDRYIRANYNHFAKCSCWMCGNPRRYYNEKTVQEKKSDESMKAQLEEVKITYHKKRKKSRQ